MAQHLGLGLGILEGSGIKACWVTDLGFGVIRVSEPRQPQPPIGPVTRPGIDDRTEAAQRAETAGTFAHRRGKGGSRPFPASNKKPDPNTSPFFKSSSRPNSEQVHVVEGGVCVGPIHIIAFEFGA